MLRVDQRFEWLQVHGLGAQIIGPWMDAVGDSLPPEPHRAWSRRFNEELAGLCSEQGGQLAGLATLSLQSPEVAARELEHAVRELGLVGAMLGTDIAGVDLAREALAPLWEAAVSLDVPIVLHPTFRGPGSGLNPRSYVNLYGRTVDTTYTATRLIVAGVFDRFPSLKLLLVHGGGFLPYQALRLDTCFRNGDLRGSVEREAPLERGLPSAYLSCFCYDTALLSVPAARMLVETVGAEKVLLGTDYPFPIADEGAAERMTDAYLDPATRELVLGGNAQRLFRIIR